MSRQRGEGRAGFLITLALFAMGVFVLVKYIPVRVNAYQFREALREEVRLVSVHNDQKASAARLLERAEELGIPLDPANLSIKRSKRQAVITARYEQKVDFKVTIYNYKFHDEQTAPVF